LLSPLKLLYDGSAHGYDKAVLKDSPDNYRVIYVTTTLKGQVGGWHSFATLVPATLPRDAPWRLKIGKMAVSFETRDPKKPHQYVKIGEMNPGQEWELRTIYGAE
jgi:hypothetical protein